jgi:hypothetical protein
MSMRALTAAEYEQVAAILSAEAELGPFRHLQPRESECAVDRLERDLRLQRGFEKLHELGPRPVAMFIAELINSVDVDASWLEAVLDWCVGADAELIAAVGADRWPRPVLDLVPDDLGDAS